MDGKLHELEQRIAQLEAQIAALQTRTPPVHDPILPTILVAPVHIVDKDGRLLATLEHRTNDLSLRLFNQYDIAVAALGIDGTHAGYVALRNAEGKLLALVDVETSGARLQLEDHDQRGGVVLFAGDTGEQAGGGIHVNHTAGGVSIALWSRPTGGEVTIYDGQPNETILSTMPMQTPTQDGEK